MAAMTIIRPPVCSDAAESMPQNQWPLLIKERRTFCREVLPSDCRLLLFFIEDAERSRWLGYETRDQYLRDGLQLDPEVVDLALKGLRLTDPQKAIGLDEVVILGKRGRPKTGEEKGDNVTLKSRGNARAYTLARLVRDGETDLAAKVRAGEISANAAALKAGFRKKPLKRCPECGHEWR